MQIIEMTLRLAVYNDHAFILNEKIKPNVSNVKMAPIISENLLLFGLQTKTDHFVNITLSKYAPDVKTKCFFRI